MDGAELTELIELERLIDGAASRFEVDVACRVDAGTRAFPVYALALGSTDRNAPAVGFFGGVHGLERIGTRVLLMFIRSLLARLNWDSLLHDLLGSVRLVFMPLVNPGGMWRSTRSNPRGVDLMRNAPLDACDRTVFLIGGQRISPRLPWYRGSGEMEAESQALCRFVEKELLARPFSAALDCHSGFGLRDRIWFPFAFTRAPMEHLAEVGALAGLFERSYPAHDYVVEPQSRHYLAHGDLWDYLYLRSRAGGGVFLPLTLEMGSWSWVRKRPSQLFSREGLFNPLAPHRLQRVLRRHLIWMEFLARAARAHRRWLPCGDERAHQHQAAVARWYRGTTAS